MIIDKLKRMRTTVVFTILLVYQNNTFSAEHYLPINLNPAIEAKIERLLVAANIPVITRPIPLSHVRQALKKVGDQDPVLSVSIEKYLQRYEQKLGVSHLQATVFASSGANTLQNNERGVETNSSYRVSGSVFWQANDYVIANVGGFAYNSDLGKKDEFLENSYLSLGGSYLQLDIGTRPHWFGPFQDSDMLLTTNASALPSVTFSNSKPISFLGFRYEVFFAQMSESDLVRSEDRSQRLTGNPRLFGLHASFQPIEGFALGFNRLMQYGGADRDDSLSSLFEAFIDAKDQDNVLREGNDFGNQISSITTRFTFPGKSPLSIYMEYAGEDTSHTSNVHLGNSALMLGVHVPRVTDRLDVTYEFAEWQNAWYVNGNYGDGLRQYETIMGNWGANHRNFSNAGGAASHMAKVNWYVDSKKTVITKFRQLKNENCVGLQCKTSQAIEAEFNQQLTRFSLGFSLLFGQDSFGSDYSQFGGSIRW